MFDSTFGTKEIPPGGKPNMLHVLSRATPEDQNGQRGPIFTATCGHDCVATPQTHELMKDTDFQQVAYCFNCFNQETNS